MYRLPCVAASLRWRGIPQVRSANRALCTARAREGTLDGPREFMKVEEKHIDDYVLYHPPTFTVPPTTSGATQASALTQSSSERPAPTRPLLEILPGNVEGMILAYTFQDCLMDVMRKKYRVPVGAWCLGPSTDAALKQWDVKQPYCTPVFASQMTFSTEAEDGGDAAGEGTPEAIPVFDVLSTRTTNFELAFTFRLAHDVALKEDTVAETTSNNPNPTLKPLTISSFDAVFPTLLFMGSRFPYCAPHLAAHVADLCGVTGMALGNGFLLTPAENNSGFCLHPPDWIDYGGVLLLNDDPIAVGRGSQNLFGRGPVDAAVELVQSLRSQQRLRKQLKRGTLLCAGPCTSQPMSIQLAQSIYQDRRLRAAASANTEADSLSRAPKSEDPDAVHGMMLDTSRSHHKKAASLPSCPRMTASFGPFGKVTVQLKGFVQ